MKNPTNGTRKTWLVLLGAAMSLYPTVGHAGEQLRSPNKSANGDIWCESGLNQNRLFCNHLSTQVPVLVGPRKERADRFRGPGNVICAATYELALHPKGFLHYCRPERGHTVLMQKRDGNFCRATNFQLIEFDESGFCLGDGAS